MKKFLGLTLAAITIIGMISCNMYEDDDNGSGNFTLTLLHLNDTHGQIEPYQKSVSAFPATGNKHYFYFGGQASIKTRINQIRATKNNVLFLHAGDAFNGTLYSIEFNGIADLVMLKQMGCDVFELGNHEFDSGPYGVDLFVKEATMGSTGTDILSNTGTDHTFPVICANVDFSEEPDFDGNNVLPFVIEEVNGKKVGILGIVFDDTAGISSPGPNIIFEDEIENATAAVAALKASNVNIIVALTHVGLDRDQAIAENVADIDVIIGGHTHSFLGDFDDFGISSADDEYPLVVQGPSGKDVLIVTAGKWGWVLGQLDVTFNSLGDIVSYNGKPEIILQPYFLDANKALVDPIESNMIASYINNHPNAVLVSDDAEAVTALQPYKDHVTAIGTNVVANASAEIVHKYVPDDVDDPGNFGSIIADAYMWKMTNGAANPYDVCNFVIMNSGGVRAPILAGDDIYPSDGTPPITITVNKVFEVSPFGNTLVIIDVSAAELYAMIEDCCDTPGGFANVSGIRYTVTDTESYPSGTTNNSITCNSIYWTQGTNALANGGQGVLLDKNDTTVKYKLIMNSFSASGGDFYDTAGALPDSRKVDPGYVDGQVVLEYYQHIDSLGLMIDPIPSTERISYQNL